MCRLYFAGVMTVEEGLFAQFHQPLPWVLSPYFLSGPSNGHVLGTLSPQLSPLSSALCWRDVHKHKLNQDPLY